LPNARFTQKRFWDGVHSFRDLVQLFRSGEKLDNITPESLDNFLRNQWTTSAGISGQLAPEYAPRLALREIAGLFQLQLLI
jgi:hypothetical protein